MPPRAPSAATPWLDTRAIHIARLRLGENGTHRWNERAKVDESVACCVQHHHGDPSCRNVLLELKILIHGDQGVETLVARASEQNAVLASLPAEIGNVSDVEPRKLTFERAWCGLV